MSIITSRNLGLHILFFSSFGRYLWRYLRLHLWTRVLDSRWSDKVCIWVNLSFIFSKILITIRVKWIFHVESLSSAQYESSHAVTGFKFILTRWRYQPIGCINQNLEIRLMYSFVFMNCFLIKLAYLLKWIHTDQCYH